MLGGGLSNKHNSLKLKKFKGNNSRRKVIITTIILSILLLSGIYLYSSFAAFTEEKHFNVINGEVTDPGDIYFAYYVDGEITRSIPTEGSGYTLDIEKSNCTNGVSISFDDYNYAVITSYKNYNATDYTRTRCNLYFKKLDMQLTDYIKKLALYDNPNLTYDGTIGNNLRYIGSNPNNYVSVDGELWRIIGVMNNIDDGTGKKESRIKLIRAESIGSYSWDTSDSSVNSGLGINEWSQADIMKLLNPGYASELVGGSLYWNSGSGTCYKGSNNNTTSCDFTSIGIKDKLKSLISDAVWHTGSNDGKTYTYSNILTSRFYELESTSNNGKICTSGTYCNDKVERTTTWTGKVGLMYASDYGYATSGGSTTDRATCLNKELYNWDNSSVSDCKNNDWLLSSTQWLLSPSAYSSSACRVFAIRLNGIVINGDAFGGNVIRPVVYLKSSVKITSGDGSESNPYTLSV